MDRALLRTLEEATSVIELPRGLESLRAVPAENAQLAESASGEAFALPLAEATETFRRQYVAHLRQRFGSDLNAAARHAGIHPKSISRLFRMYDAY